jgi:hypothetical protein
LWLCVLFFKAFSGKFPWENSLEDSQDISLGIFGVSFDLKGVTSMTLLPLIECCERLTIDPKTLRHWVRQATLPLSSHPSDARIKCLTIEQVQHLAALHGRALKPDATATPSSLAEPSPLHAVGVQDAGMGARRETEVTALQHEEDWPGRLADLERQVAFLQQQLACLTSSLLLVQRLPSDPALATLGVAALQAMLQPVWRTEPAQTSLASLADGVPYRERLPHPAESRGRRVLPLIEYGARGLYVVVCPYEGQLQITPDTPEWFAWLASLSSFRFVGKVGRLSVCREYRHGPKRSWYAHREIHQHTYKQYLGPTERLTLARLEQVAVTFQSYVDMA